MAAAGGSNRCVVLGDVFLVGDRDSVASALSKHGFKVVVSIVEVQHFRSWVAESCSDANLFL